MDIKAPALQAILVASSLTLCMICLFFDISLIIIRSHRLYTRNSPGIGLLGDISFIFPFLIALFNKVLCLIFRAEKVFEFPARNFNTCIIYLLINIIRFL